MEVKELKNKYGGKADKWIPIDKAAAKYLPKDREYTKLEALFSYQKDLDEGKDGTISGYSRLWKWSRNKVRKFLSDLETGQGHIEDRLRTDRGHSIHIINKNLWSTKGQIKDTLRTDRGQIEDTTINPNPNPNPKIKEKKNVVEQSSPTPADLVRNFFKMHYNGEQNDFYFKYANRFPNKNELNKFCEYWTERTKSGKHQRWEKQSAFELGKRIGYWCSKLKPEFNYESPEERREREWTARYVHLLGVGTIHPDMSDDEKRNIVNESLRKNP